MRVGLETGGCGIVCLCDRCRVATFLQILLRTGNYLAGVLRTGIHTVSVGLARLRPSDVRPNIQAETVFKSEPVLTERGAQAGKRLHAVNQHVFRGRGLTRHDGGYQAQQASGRTTDRMVAEVTVEANRGRSWRCSRFGEARPALQLVRGGGAHTACIRMLWWQNI